ncbi:hypothetical protein [Mumia sp. DW29H23]|uniref:hypothetical protein n=1 Tax=Mumia sp. DW29H23 TaxID=3421241 RepID=UPI003D69D53E
MISDSAAAELEAWATLGATVLACFALVLAALAWRREQQLSRRLVENEERNQEMRERAQAALVTTWLAEGEAQPVGPAERPWGHYVPLFQIFRNASETSVYQATGEYVLDGQVLGPMQPRAQVPPSVDGIGFRIANRDKARLARALGEDGSFDDVLVTITFRDAAGLWWRREIDGRLSRVDGPARTEPPWRPDLIEGDEE